MNWRLVISVVVMFLILFLSGWLLHGTLLKDDYARLSNLMRPMPEVWQRFPLMFLAQLLTALGFTFIYLRGKRDKPWFGQGIRYAIAVAVLATIPVNLVHYVVMPFPPDLVLKQASLDVATIMLMAVVLAWINR
jgi:cytochrome bd-type quinol oxidase subunit 2